MRSIRKARVQGKVLTREDFLNNRHDTMITEAGLDKHIKRTPPERRLARKSAMIRTAPPGPMIWVFGYGSLIWNPAFHYDERRVGTLYGYHRQFCFWSKIGRGSPEAPGMMLGLDKGGSCRGVVLGVRRERAGKELSSVFMREMTGETYHAVWGRVLTHAGWVRAITFVANRDCDNYAGRKPLDFVAGHIAHGRGHLGPCRDYLFNTTEHLAELGIRDRMLSRLCRLVESKSG